MTPTQSAGEPGKRSVGLFYAFIAGMACSITIGTIAVIQLDFAANPAISTMRSSNSRQLLEKNYNLDYRDMNTCPLMILGKELEDDKFYHHTYGDLYCENLMPFRISRQKLRMLEIGLGCGHHNSGRSAQGATNYQLADVVANTLLQANHIISFLFLLQSVWKRFFTEDGGPGVSLYEVDYGPSEKHSKCAEKFQKNHPDTCDGIYLVSLFLLYHEP